MGIYEVHKIAAQTNAQRVQISYNCCFVKRTFAGKNTDFLPEG